MTGQSRPDADEHGVLEQLGFLAPSSSAPVPSQNHLPPHARAAIEAPPAAPTRREAREQANKLPVKRSSKSAERRIRAVQKDRKSVV